MSSVPSGKRSISIERRTPKGSPTLSKLALRASMVRPCSASSSGVNPFAIRSVWE
jgi:hypothetical protein